MKPAKTSGILCDCEVQFGAKALQLLSHRCPADAVANDDFHTWSGDHYQTMSDLWEIARDNTRFDTLTLSLPSVTNYV
jgi:hypothetical protein